MDLEPSIQLLGFFDAGNVMSRWTDKNHFQLPRTLSLYLQPKDRKIRSRVHKQLLAGTAFYQIFLDLPFTGDVSSATDSAQYFPIFIQ